MKIMQGWEFDDNEGDGSATEGEVETSDEVELTEDIPASVLSPGIGKKLDPSEELEIGIKDWRLQLKRR